jgi:hypothetical protein
MRCREQWVLIVSSSWNNTQMTHGLRTWCGLFYLLWIQCSVLFCDTVLRCVTVLILCIVLFVFIVFTVSACNVRAATLTEPGYNSQRREMTRTSQISFKLFDMCVPNFFWLLWMFRSLFCFLFLCKCVLFYCHRMSAQLQLNIYHKIYVHNVGYLPHVTIAGDRQFKR